MVVLNPITNAASLAVDGNLHPEKRMQELLHCWLKDRFTGAPITVDGLARGTTGQRTFDLAAVTWAESAESGEGKPLIHLAVVDHRKARRAIKGWTIQYRHVWTIQVLVKVPRNLTGTGRAPQPDFLARKVAADLEWLIESPEKLALAAVGIQHLAVRGPSVPVATSQWQARALVIECVTRSGSPRQG